MQPGIMWRKLTERRAQITMPSVLLAPIFILVIYLLFETAKVSMTKVRHQFALDNAAYSQIAVASTYLNAVALVNGPMPFRVMRYYGDPSQSSLPLKEGGKAPSSPEALGDPITIFELFYRSGAVPSMLGDKDGRVANLRPPQEAVDWKVQYADPMYDSNESEGKEKIVISRRDWNKELPVVPGDNERVRLISKEIVEQYHFPALKVGVPVLTQYLTTYVYDGSIYKSQDYVYKELTKNLIMFREAYYLNVPSSNCKKSECGRESAAKLRPFLNIGTKPFEIDKIQVHFSDGGKDRGDTHGGAYPTPLSATELLQGQKLFQFAYLDPSSRSKLRSLQRGILLKQNFKLPLNHFNINLDQKYKPYVRTKASLTCPRGNNNCVWPNPLPKYSITLDP